MNLVDTFEVQMVLGLFTVEKGKIKVYLSKRTEEPYKGHWTLPSKMHSYCETFSSTVQSLLEKPFGLDEVYTEDFRTFESRETNLQDKVVHVSTIAVVDTMRASSTQGEDKESDWFDTSQLPKLAYHHGEMIESMVSYLRKRFRDTDMIQILFPEEFTLPELQGFCEQLEGKKFDRRNFRKKVFALDVIEDTGSKSGCVTGRPASLYQFKKGIKEIKLF